MDEELARRLDRITLLLALVGAALVALLASLVDTGTILGFVIAVPIAGISVVALLSVISD